MHCLASNRIRFSMWRSLLWASSCCVTDHVSLIEKQTHQSKIAYYNIQHAISCLTYSKLDYVSQIQIVFCFYLAICVRKQTGTDGIILHKLLKLNPLFSYKRFIFKQKLSRQRQIGYGKIANISIMSLS